MFLTRTSCLKTTHADGYYGAWAEWAVSVTVLPLTVSSFLLLYFLSLAVLGLRCCSGFSLVVVSRSYSLVAVQGLLISMASLVVLAQRGL